MQKGGRQGGGGGMEGRERAGGGFLLDSTYKVQRRWEAQEME